MARSCCGGGSYSTPSPPPPIYQSINYGSMEKMASADYVWVQLDDTNTGDHPVKGLTTKTFYGYRKHGDRFLMHKGDASAHSAANQRKLRVKVLDTKDKADQIEPKKLQSPKPVVKEDSVVVEPPVVLVEDVPAVSSISLLTDKQLVELEAMGVISVQDVIRLGKEGLTQIRGIGDAKAEQILDKAAQLLSEGGEDVTESSE